MSRTLMLILRYWGLLEPVRNQTKKFKQTVQVLAKSTNSNPAANLKIQEFLLNFRDFNTNIYSC